MNTQIKSNPKIKIPPKIKKPRKKKWPKIVLVVTFLLIITLIILSAVSISPAQAAYAHALAGKDKLVAAQAALEQNDFQEAMNDLAEAEMEFRAAENNLDRLIWVRVIPFAGRQYASADHLVNAAVQITSAINTVVGVANEVISPVGELTSMEGISFSSITDEQKQQILEKLYEASPQLELASSQIKLAETELNKIPDTAVLSQITEAKNQVEAYLPMLDDVIVKGADLARILPSITGYPQPKTYLFLFQNNTELRPAGGFIGTYGTLKVRDGEIKKFFTDDSYNLDKNADIEIEGPWQIKKLINPWSKSWYFRDSNWSPDFPTSAQKAMEFYYLEGGTEQLDGVISITPTFIHHLLELIGPVQLPNYPITFTAENFTDQLERQVEIYYKEQGIPMEERKAVVGELAEYIMNSVFSLPREKWPEFLATVERSLDEKHLQMYFNDGDVQKIMDDENWSGRVIDFDGDYLMQVDSNMASLKTDAVMDRTLNYELNVGPDWVPQATVSIVYRNNAPGLTFSTTRYRNWARIYVPKGSVLESIEGNNTDPGNYLIPDQPYEVVDDLNKTSFGTFVVIEPWEEKTLTFKYRPPKFDKSMQKNYRLLVQKQAGVVDPGLHVRLNFPREISGYSPAGDQTYLSDNQRSIDFYPEFNTDRYFNLNLVK